MQKKDPKNAGFNKALIFICAFVISSLLIYQFYYYSRIHKLSSGIVATADELPQTVLSPYKPKHFSDTNYMGNAGLLAAIGDSTNDFSFAPAETYLSGNGVYSKAFLDELNIGISQKFPNHPPIGFGNLQENDQILFSYLFKNVLLPQTFTEYKAGINVDGKHFRAIQYMAGNDSDTNSFIQDGEITLITSIDNGTQTLIISQDAFPQRLSVSSNVNQIKNLIFPEIDFNIIKFWKPEETTFIPNAKAYKHLEERVKIKLTATQKELQEEKSKIELQPPFHIYFYKKGAHKPYFSLYIANKELLLPTRGR